MAVGYGDGAGRAARHRIASTLAREHGLTLLEDWPMPLIGVDCFVMAVPPGQSPAAAAAATMAASRGVAASQPVGLFEAQGTAADRGDPLLAAQPATVQWHLASLHRIATGRGVDIAVIDSRIDADHPDLQARVRLREDFVGGHGGPEVHGTAVAGIIAAIAGNGIGIAGVAPGARLLALRACWQAAAGTFCDSLSLAKALYFAIDHHADVINMSLAGPPDVLLTRLIDVAADRRIAVVAAYDGALAHGGFPASHPGVVAVSDDAGVAATLTNVYAAPGRDVPTTRPGARWFLVNGSSYAAAHVSGLFALLREQRRGRALSGPVLLVANGGTIDSCATLCPAATAAVCTCEGTGVIPASARN